MKSWFYIFSFIDNSGIMVKEKWCSDTPIYLRPYIDFSFRTSKRGSLTNTRSVSAIRGIVRPYFFWNLQWLSWLSLLIPMTCASSASNCGISASNPCASNVHPEAVSYTHLDVYKRQVFGGAITGDTSSDGSDEYSAWPGIVHYYHKDILLYPYEYIMLFSLQKKTLRCWLSDNIWYKSIYWYCFQIHLSFWQFFLVLLIFLFL